MKSNFNPTFTICVLTYNRGAKALNLAQKFIPEMDENWELLILDNASSLETDSYIELREFARRDHRVRYIRHDTNVLMHGNIVKALELARTDFVMLLSDEDFPNPEMIREIQPALSLPNLGLIRGSIAPIEGMKPRNSHTWAEESFFAGQEALLSFSFTNNYFSGTIYNSFLIKEYGLLEILKQGVNKNRIYPHLYLDLLVCSVCDVICTSQISCFEGIEQTITDSGDHYIGINQGPRDYSPPYSFGSRVDQFIILRDAIREAVSLIGEPFDASLFVLLYLRLCEKYFYLITKVNSPMYLDHQVHSGLLHQAMLYICGAGIAMYPEIQHCDTEIFTEIQKIHARYELFPESSQ